MGKVLHSELNRLYYWMLLYGFIGFLLCLSVFHRGSMAFFEGLLIAYAYAFSQQIVIGWSKPWVMPAVSLFRMIIIAIWLSQCGDGRIFETGLVLMGFLSYKVCSITHGVCLALGKSE
jgi:hypothetical protein